MPLYKYKAVNNAGEIKQGTYSAGDKSLLFQMIREEQYYPVKVEAVNEKKDIEFKFLKRVKINDIAVFCRQFHTMLNAGITVIQCLDILQIQTENKKLKETTKKVYSDVQKGSALSEAMRNSGGVFPQILVSMVEAGELSGNLDVIMDRMANHFEKENKVGNKVKGAMIYPSILAIVAVLVVIFLLVFVMPTFMGMFTSSGVELPAPTRILLGISDVLRKYWYIIFLVVFVLLYVLRRFLKTENGKYKWDKLKLRIPVLKVLVTKIATARFSRTLSTLMGSGIPLLQAMDSVAKVVGNSVISKAIESIQEDMRKGMDLSTPIKKIDVFPPMVASMVSIGEESGTLEDVLEKTADFYDEEVDAATQKLVSMLDPVILIFMAAIIGFIVISIALPMFGMFETIQ